MSRNLSRMLTASSGPQIPQGVKPMPLPGGAQPQRVSPGRYMVNGQIVNSPTAAGAMNKYSAVPHGNAPSTPKPFAPGQAFDPGHVSGQPSDPRPMAPQGGMQPGQAFNMQPGVMQPGAMGQPPGAPGQFNMGSFTGNPVNSIFAQLANQNQAMNGNMQAQQGGAGGQYQGQGAPQPSNMPQAQPMGRPPMAMPWNGGQY